MSQKSDLHPISLQYQVRTNKQGCREIERLLPLLGELQNAAIRHRRMLGRAGVPTKEILRLQNEDITDLRKHDPDFRNIARRLAESVVKRVNDAYQRAFTVPGARFPRTRSPYDFHTLDICEPSVNHVQFRKSGIAEIHIKGLPSMWFRTDHRINVLEQPRAIRITQYGRALTATLVYQFPDYEPSPAPYTSCGIDPGIVQRLTVGNDQQQFRQFSGIDASQHHKTTRRLKRKMQRCRDAALRDDRARWANVKRRDGTTKRRFRWNQKPSRKYLHVMAQLRRVERKRIKTLQAAEHRITTQIVRNHEIIAVEDTAIANMTRSAKGTMEKPGKNVAQKRGLNRSILSQRWYSISQKLEYKSGWYGRQFMRVPAQYTSQTCPACGNVDAGNRLSQARFDCMKCGTRANTDVIGAENIRCRGVEAAAGVTQPDGTEVSLITSFLQGQQDGLTQASGGPTAHGQRIRHSVCITADDDAGVGELLPCGQCHDA